MERALSAPLFAGALAVGMLLFLELGRRVGRRRAAGGEQGVREGLGPMERSVFALFGLLLAFIFAGSLERFDAKRHLIADESNAIGTAYLRLDLLSAAEQAPMRELFRSYLDSRLEIYRKLPDLAAAMAEMRRSERLQRTIWERAVAATTATAACHPDAGKLLLPALNEMIDITTTRTMAARVHTPRIVFYLLLGLGFFCAMLVGHGLGVHEVSSGIHTAVYAIAIAVTVFTIVDLEYPRAGFFRFDSYDQVLVDLRASMR